MGLIIDPWDTESVYRQDDQIVTQNEKDGSVYQRLDERQIFERKGNVIGIGKDVFSISNGPSNVKRRNDQRDTNPLRVLTKPQLVTPTPVHLFK